MQITFDQLPNAVAKLLIQVENLERLLQKKDIQPVTSERWFDLTELCNYLPDKPSKPTVYAWVHHLLIPYHKKSKKLIFLKTEIDDWLKSGRKKTAAEIAIDADNLLSNKKPR